MNPSFTKRVMALSASFLAAILLTQGAATSWAKSKTFLVNDSKNSVEFSSDAPVELIKGYTNKVRGTIQYDDNFTFDSRHPFNITFDVDLASFDTGIPLRNEHMRDNFLHTKKYPKAIFRATKITANKKPPFKNGQVVMLRATGPLTVHGKTVIKTIPIKATYLKSSTVTRKRFAKAGDVVRLQATFPIKLQQHGIQRPEAIFVKLADTVFVSIDAFAAESSAGK